MAHGAQFGDGLACTGQRSDTRWLQDTETKLAPPQSGAFSLTRAGEGLFVQSSLATSLGGPKAVFGRTIECD